MTSLLTSQEIQDLLNVDLSTVYRMAEDGRLPGVKVGRQWRFPADRVALQLGLQTPTPQEPLLIPMTPPGSAIGHLLQPEVAQSAADLIGDLFGVMAVITDMEGAPVSGVANQCGYYAAIAEQPGAVDACLSQWRLFAEEPHLSPRWVRTHLGFLCARTFVWVDLRPVGMIVVGGVTPPAWPPQHELLESIAAEFGVSAQVLAGSVTQTWSVDADGQKRILRLLPQFGDLVSHLLSARSRLVGIAEGRSPAAGSAAPGRSSDPDTQPQGRGRA